jgi:hypothetical protein
LVSGIVQIFDRIEAAGGRYIVAYSLDDVSIALA